MKLFDPSGHLPANQDAIGFSLDRAIRCEQLPRRLREDLYGDPEHRPAAELLGLLLVPRDPHRAGFMEMAESDQRR